MTPRRRLAAAAAVLGIYAVLAVAVAKTKRPWCDEAWYASPGLNLLQAGYMGTSVLDPSSTTWKNVKLNGIDRHTYWAMPLHFVASAAWYRAFGFSLFTMRALSIAWGALALAAWFLVVYRLSENEGVAWFATLLLACDYMFVNRAADGRMDAMAAALAACALAAYLQLRRTSVTRAVLAGNCLAAAAFFTHPNGGALAALGLIVLFLRLDRARWRPVMALAAAAPYAAGGLAWGAYILRDPASFRAQFFSAAANRWDGIAAPWSALRAELTLRYLNQFGFAPWSGTLSRVDFAIPLAYFAAVAALLAVPSLRRRHGYATLALFAAAQFVYMTLFEGFKAYFYFVHIAPLFAAALGICLYESHRRWAAAAAAATVAFCGIQVLKTARVVRADPYRTSYLPAVAFLQNRTAPSTVIVGSAELAFALGFRPNLVDDILLGYRSGRSPDVIVVDEARYGDNLKEFTARDEAFAQYTSKLLANYRAIYGQGAYRIYERSDLIGRESTPGTPDSHIPERTPGRGTS